MKGPIGIFDSGYGGLTVLKSIHNLLPNYDCIYLGDNARAPYGDRSFDVVYDYTLDAVRFLFEKGCHLVILACNTSSAKALRSIQQNDLQRIDPNKRVLGVIRPCIEEIAENKQINNVGIIGTQGTIRSNSYGLEIKKYAPNVKFTQHACPLWVPLIENKKHTSSAGINVIKNDIEELLNKAPKIDTLVLACTHYPIVEPLLREILPQNIKVLSQGPVVGNKLTQYLMAHPEMEARCSKGGRVQFLTSEQEALFNESAHSIIGETIESIHVSF